MRNVLAKWQRNAKLKKKGADERHANRTQLKNQNGRRTRIQMLADATATTVPIQLEPLSFAEMLRYSHVTYK